MVEIINHLVMKNYIFKKKQKNIYSQCIYNGYMATEMITVKMDDKFLSEVDNIVKKHGYQSRTEFIRNALREKIEETKLKEAMQEIAYLKGASKKKTSEKEYEEIRRKAFEELEKKFK